MTTLPAIAIGGPPHSGKSVLTYSLTQLLRDQQIDHYVLRACPDGEGDWSNEVTPATVQAIRRKGEFTPAFITNVCMALQQRHLPLLVDVGGRPSKQDEAIFRQCTHLIILSATAEGLDEWRTFAAAMGLPVIAELRSVLDGETGITATYPLLQGQFADLVRGRRVYGPALAQLAGVVRTIFAVKSDALRAVHLAQAPVELAVDLDRVANCLGVKQDGLWRPAEIQPVLDYLPTQTPLAIYGRGTNWLYTALALYTWPAAFYQFDARLGWVKPAVLLPTPNAHATHLAWTTVSEPHFTRVKVQIPATYLDYDNLQGAAIPEVAPDRGVILDGKLPYWLWTSLALAYGAAPWLAVYQPQVGDVVVWSRQAEPQVGTVLPIVSPIANPDSAAPSTLGPPKASPPK